MTGTPSLHAVHPRIASMASIAASVAEGFAHRPSVTPHRNETVRIAWTDAPSTLVPQPPPMFLFSLAAIALCAGTRAALLLVLRMCAVVWSVDVSGSLPLQCVVRLWHMGSVAGSLLVSSQREHSIQRTAGAKKGYS